MNGICRRLKNYPIVLLSLLLFLGACSYKNRNVLLKDPKELKLDTLKTIYVSNNGEKSYDVYRIKAYDILNVRNLQDASLIGGETSQGTTTPGRGTEFIVEPDGFVNLPVIGKVPVIGLSRMEARKLIEEIYKEKLFKNPIIDLQIINLNVTVLGEVRAPGNYVLKNEKTDLIDLIGLVGGINLEGKTKNVRIIRGNRDNPEIIYVNLNNINSLSSDKLILQDKDIIIVESKRFYSFARNTQPVFVLINSFITILSIYLIIDSISKN